jgi:hypothetical protein
LYPIFALAIAVPPLCQGFMLAMPRRPCIGGFTLVIAATPLYRGIAVLVIGDASVFGVFPTYLSTFFSVAAEFILHA